MRVHRIDNRTAGVTRHPAQTVFGDKLWILTVIQVNSKYDAILGN